MKVVQLPHLVQNNTAVLKKLNLRSLDLCNIPFSFFKVLTYSEMLPFIHNCLEDKTLFYL